jgi:hypothetical protein
MKVATFLLVAVGVIAIVYLQGAPCARADCHDLDDIVGAWQWLQTGGGLTGRWYGPEHYGYDHTLTFAQDSTATAEWDGNILVESFTLWCEEPYQISHIRFASAELFPMFPLYVEFNFSVYTWNDTTRLYLSSLPSDGYNHRFMRPIPNVVEENRSWGSIKAVYR